MSHFNSSILSGNVQNIPQVTGGECDYSKIEVRSGSALRQNQHLFIVYTDKSGKEFFIRGGPSETPVPFAGGGDIDVKWGGFFKGIVDWEPNPRLAKTVKKGGVDPSVWNCLVDAGRKINGAGVTYYLTGPNSNTVVKTLLVVCNLPVPPEGASYTGWTK